MDFCVSCLVDLVIRVVKEIELIKGYWVLGVGQPMFYNVPQAGPLIDVSGGAIQREFYPFILSRNWQKYISVT